MGVHYGKGKYNCTGVEAALQESSKGQPMLALKFTVDSECQKDGSETPCEGYERRLWLVVDEADEEGMDKAVRKMRQIGFQGIKMEDFPKWFVGKEFYANCWIGTNKKQGTKYFGQEQENWDVWTPKAESKPLENKTEVAKKMNAILGKKLKETATAAPAEPPKVEAKVEGDSSGIPDDEVPF